MINSANNILNNNNIIINYNNNKIINNNNNINNSNNNNFINNKNDNNNININNNNNNNISNNKFNKYNVNTSKIKKNENKNNLNINQRYNRSNNASPIKYSKEGIHSIYISNNNLNPLNKSTGTTNVIIINPKNKEKRMNNIRNRGKSLLKDGPKIECSICHFFIETHLLKIHLNSHPSQIFDWMFLGTFENACDIKELKRNDIHYILNCAGECNNIYLPNDIKELHLNIRDEKNFDLTEFFEEANVFINNVRLKGEIILIHCKFGISRSVSFIIAYLVKYMGYTVENAMNYIKKKKKTINPNKGFIDQLIVYEKSLKDRERQINVKI